jgi:hypothetical protein
MSREQFMSFEKVYPNNAVLGRYFDASRASVSLLKNSGSKLYDAYIDAWNLDNIVMVNLVAPSVEVA